MNSELLKVIEAEAAAETERILAAARTQAGEIRADAEASAQLMRDEAGRARTESERVTRLKAGSAADLAASALVLATKSTVLDSVFNAARKKLDALDSSRYRPSLKALIAEAAAGFGAPFVVKVRAADLKPAGEIIKELKLDAKAETDDAVDGGLIASDREGRMSVSNRFSDRLERARPALLPRLSQILWG